MSASLVGSEMCIRDSSLLGRNNIDSAQLVGSILEGAEAPHGAGCGLSRPARAKRPCLAHRMGRKSATPSFRRCALGAPRSRGDPGAQSCD
eukprot:11522062-Alexandrium_andersonii.AAC.1